MKEVNPMAGEEVHAVKRMIQMESDQVQLEVGSFFDKMTAMFPQDRIDGPKKTRLFALAVSSETTGRINQYVAVTAVNHCSANYRVEHGKFRIQIQNKGNEPGPDWHHCLRWDKGDGHEWWENEPADRKISKEIIECVSKARKSMAQ
jgi:hypothetical protein